LVISKLQSREQCSHRCKIRDLRCGRFATTQIPICVLAWKIVPQAIAHWRIRVRQKRSRINLIWIWNPIINLSPSYLHFCNFCNHLSVWRLPALLFSIVLPWILPETMAWISFFRSKQLNDSITVGSVFKPSFVLKTLYNKKILRTAICAH
jgi:hypothetical protein